MNNMSEDPEYAGSNGYTNSLWKKIRGKRRQQSMNAKRRNKRSSEDANKNSYITEYLKPNDKSPNIIGGNIFRVKYNIIKLIKWFYDSGHIKENISPLANSVQWSHVEWLKDQWWFEEPQVPWLDLTSDLKRYTYVKYLSWQAQENARESFRRALLEKKSIYWRY